jgi:hypothetical protein
MLSCDAGGLITDPIDEQKLFCTLNNDDIVRLGAQVRSRERFSYLFPAKGWCWGFGGGGTADSHFACKSELAV